MEVVKNAWNELKSMSIRQLSHQVVDLGLNPPLYSTSNACPRFGGNICSDDLENFDASYWQRVSSSGRLERQHGTRYVPR